MCYEIDSDIILANYLRRSYSLNFRTLRGIRGAIGAYANANVHVDISVSALSSAVENYPSMFRWNGNCIERVEGADAFFSEEYVNDHFNWQLQESIRERVLDAIGSMEVAV